MREDEGINIHKVRTYGGIESTKDNLPSVTISGRPLQLSRHWLTDEVVGPFEQMWVLTFWLWFRWPLFLILLWIPWYLYSLPHLMKCSITSLLGIIACCLPSGGAPVAGGIIFIPALTYLGLGPKECVAFCSYSIMIGCGIFTPANWGALDPGIIIKSTVWVVIPASLIGIYISMFLIPVKAEEVHIVFTLFCVFLVATVIHGLFHTLVSQDEPVTILEYEEEIEYDRIKESDDVEDSFSSGKNTSTGVEKKRRILWFSRGTLMNVLVYAIVGVIGGMLVGWIGIGVEKIYFLIATNYHKAEIKRSTVTAITIVGWLSVVAAALHTFVFHDVPFDWVICAYPGLLIGSIIGPNINAYLGSKNIMVIFCLFLLFNIAFDCYGFLGYKY